MEEFKPKLITSGLIDFVTFLAVGLFQAAIMFVLPGYLCYLATGNTTLGVLFGVALYFIFMLYLVNSITISKSGITLKRIFGNPKKVAWECVRGFSEATPKEVIILGWLWPLFPAREMTPCMSCKGHVRIQLNDGYFYYPPRDLMKFIETLERYGAKKL